VRNSTRFSKCHDEINRQIRDGRTWLHTWGMQEISTKILMENLRGRGHFADQGEERKTGGY